MKAWRQLSPPGVSAVTMVAVSGDLGGLDIKDQRGRPARWPASGESVLRLLCHGGSVLDEALVLGTADGAELHLHGGAGTATAVQAWLDRAGFARQAPAPGPRPTSLRHARALLSAWCGPLASLRRHASGESRRALDEGPASLRADLQRCRAQRALGERMARMPVVALVGLPNAGKSTLFNALAGSERALVAPEAGTTRDTVRALVQLRGLAVQLCDTAGRVPSSAREEPADLLVHVLGEPEEQEWLAPSAQPVLRVLGKVDLRSHGEGVSGKTGHGVPQLLDRIADALLLPPDSGCDLWAPADPALLRWLAEPAAPETPAWGGGDSEPAAT